MNQHSSPQLRSASGMLQASMGRLPRFGPGIASRPVRRVSALDGLRGWAALSVICFHFTWELFGQIEPIYRNVVTASLLDGSVAVPVFFVLSGEALSASYFAGKGPRAVIELAVKRYPRLAIPILAASALTTLLAVSGLCSNQAAARIIDRTDWLGAFLTTPVDVGRMLRFSFYDVFTEIDPRDSLVPFLWSMRLEWIGSILTFVTLLICHGRQTGWIIYAGILCVMLVGYAGHIQTCGNLACFLVGIGLAKLRSTALLDHAHESPLVGATTALLILVVLGTDGVLHAGGHILWRGPGVAMALVALATLNRGAENFFASGLSRFLGHISFPLFLVQFPVLVSVASATILLAGPANVHRFSPAIAISGIAVCIAVAILFSPIEDLTKTACNYLAGFLPWRIQQKRL